MHRSCLGHLGWLQSIVEYITHCSFLFEFCRCPQYTSEAKQDRFIVLDIFWPSLERWRWPHERRRTNPVPEHTHRSYVALSVRGYPVSPLWDCANWKETFFSFKRARRFARFISIPRAALRRLCDTPVLDRDVSALSDTSNLIKTIAISYLHMYNIVLLLTKEGAIKNVQKW